MRAGLMVLAALHNSNGCEVPSCRLWAVTLNDLSRDVNPIGNKFEGVVHQIAAGVVVQDVEGVAADQRVGAAALAVEVVLAVVAAMAVVRKARVEREPVAALRHTMGEAGVATPAITELATGIMRFMAILSLCLVAIFALVQSIPLTPIESARLPSVMSRTSWPSIRTEPRFTS